MKYPIIKIGKTSDPHMDGTSFVGVSHFGTTDKISIVVPYGVKIDSEVDSTNEGQKEQYVFLKRYVKAIQKALSSNFTKERLEEKSGIHNPIAAVNLLHDYLSMGKYIEQEGVCKLSERGKIDFNQTVNKVCPDILDGAVYYRKFFTRKRDLIEDNFVAQVQCNVINHFMEHGGVVLFGQSISIPIGPIKLNDITVTRLRKELPNTFNSRKENIIRWCIAYIEGLRNLDEENNNEGNWKYAIIASTLWEVMIDSVLGNQTDRNKAKYGKTYEFTYIDGRTPTRGKPTQHDTIYEDDESVVIIDAKMYGSQNDLLSEKVLGKQFGYYEQAKLIKRMEIQKKNIINVLILPHIGHLDPPYFQNKVILDPHTSPETDPFKIIYLFEYPANELIEDYYFDKRKGEWFIEDFKQLIQDPEMDLFLKHRGAEYCFKGISKVPFYHSWH